MGEKWTTVVSTVAADEAVETIRTAAEAGVDAVLTPGESAQHPHGVGLVLRLAEHLALALDHRVKAADDVIGVFLGHGAGLGGGQSLGKVRRGIRRDLRLVHVAGDDSIVRDISSRRRGLPEARIRAIVCFLSGLL